MTISGSPLIHTARNGHKDVVRILIDRGAQPNNLDIKFKSTPLHQASAHDHLDVVKVLLDAGAQHDIMAAGDLYRIEGEILITPLHIAA